MRTTANQYACCSDYSHALECWGHGNNNICDHMPLQWTMKVTIESKNGSVSLPNTRNVTRQYSMCSSEHVHNYSNTMARYNEHGIYYNIIK